MSDSGRWSFDLEACPAVSKRIIRVAGGGGEWRWRVILEESRAGYEVWAELPERPGRFEWSYWMFRDHADFIFEWAVMCLRQQAQVEKDLIYGTGANEPAGILNSK